MIDKSYLRLRDERKGFWSCVKCGALTCQEECQEICFHCQDPDCQVLPVKDTQCVSCRQMCFDSDIFDVTGECRACGIRNYEERKREEEAEEERRVYQAKCFCHWCDIQYRNTSYMVRSGLGYTGRCRRCLEELIERLLAEEELDRLEGKETCFRALCQKLRKDWDRTDTAIFFQERRRQMMEESLKAKKKQEREHDLRPFKEKVKEWSDKAWNFRWQGKYEYDQYKLWKKRMNMKKYAKMNCELMAQKFFESAKELNRQWKEAAAKEEEARKALEEAEKCYG